MFTNTLTYHNHLFFTKLILSELLQNICHFKWPTKFVESSNMTLNLESFAIFGWASPQQMREDITYVPSSPICGNHARLYGIWSWSSLCYHCPQCITRFRTQMGSSVYQFCAQYRDWRGQMLNHAVNWCVSRWNGCDTMDVITFSYHVWAD